jgi:hypothetical protein
LRPQGRATSHTPETKLKISFYHKAGVNPPLFLIKIMLTKKEILMLVEKSNLSPELASIADMILRNYYEEEQVSDEKLEIICQLIVKN